MLLLDVGNTVAYLDHGALARALNAAGLAADRDTLARSETHAKRRYAASLKQGLGHADGWGLFMRELLAEAGLGAEQAAEGARIARRTHDDFNLWRAVPQGLTDALDRLRESGTRLAVVSNSEGKLPELFARIGLQGYFEQVVDSHIEGVSKPDPEIFHRALQRMQATPEQALYAGDIPDVDVDGARAAGIDAVLIDTLGHYPDYDEAPRFDSVVQFVEHLEW